MTKSYALKKLLEHGELTLAQIIEITGWPYKSGRKVVYRLKERGEIGGSDGVYFL